MRTVTRSGIARNPLANRTRLKPLTALHLAVLDALSEREPRHTRMITATLDASGGQITNALYLLSRRGLATRTGDGWVKLPAEGTQ